MPWQKDSSLPTVLLPAPAADDEEAQLLKGRSPHSFANCIGETMFLSITLLPPTSLPIQRNSIQILGVLVYNGNLVETNVERCNKEKDSRLFDLIRRLHFLEVCLKAPSHRRPPFLPLSPGTFVFGPTADQGKGGVFRGTMFWLRAWGAFYLEPHTNLSWKNIGIYLILFDLW